MGRPAKSFIRRIAQALYAKFIEPRSFDEDDRRRERILNIILASSLIMLVVLEGLLVYYSLLQGPRYQEMSASWFSVIVAFFFLLYALSRRGYFVAASYLLIATYFASVSYASYDWGVNLPSALLGYALLIVIANILINGRFGFILTAAIAIFIVPLWHFQFYGMILLVKKAPPNNSDALVFAILFFLLTMVAWLSNSEIENSLVRARTSEDKLKEELDHLEATVLERTRELRQAQLEKVETIYRLAAFGDLASGLFHNLINMLMSLLPTERRDRDAVALAENIKNFAESMRRQLQYGNVEQLFSLNDAIDYAVNLLDYKAHQAGVVILFKRKKDVMYYGNRFQFHNVLMNLIGNAIESYSRTADGRSDRHKTVHIVVTASEQRITLSIKDNGCGIPKEGRDKIFEPFFTTKESGMGIGLSLVKKVVEEELHGTITVVSKLRKGTRFTIDFPYAEKSS
jgi:signal transduction histidine kinase